MKPVHRDDIPYELAEEIVETLKEQFPGYKIQFAGDVTISPQIQKAIDSLHADWKKSLDLGICFDCGRSLPNYTGPDMETNWVLFRNNDEPAFWVCPECDGEV